MLWHALCIYVPKSHWVELPAWNIWVIYTRRYLVPLFARYPCFTFYTFVALVKQKKKGGKSSYYRLSMCFFGSCIQIIKIVFFGGGGSEKKSKIANIFWVYILFYICLGMWREKAAVLLCSLKDLDHTLTLLCWHKILLFQSPSCQECQDVQRSRVDKSWHTKQQQKSQKFKTCHENQISLFGLILPGRHWPVSQLLPATEQEMCFILKGHDYYIFLSR